MNKYYKHQSAGLQRPDYRVTARPRCPVTANLIEQGTGTVIVVDADGTVVTPATAGNQERSRKSYLLSWGAFQDAYSIQLKNALGIA